METVSKSKAYNFLSVKWWCAAGVEEKILVSLLSRSFTLTSFFENDSALNDIKITNDRDDNDGAA